MEPITLSIPVDDFDNESWSSSQLRKLSERKYLPTWQQLRNLGNSKVLKTSYLWFIAVPIAARLLEQLEDPLMISIFGQTHSIQLALPFSWYFFFFAAVCFSIATLIFTLRCPNIIKDFNNPRDSYMAGNGAIFLVEELKHIQGYLFDRAFRELVMAAFAIAIQKSRGNGTLDSEAISEFATGNRSIFEVCQDISEEIYHVKREEMNDLFAIIYNTLSRSNPNSRLIVTVLFIAGFGFMGVVLIENIYFVASKWFEW